MEEWTKLHETPQSLQPICHEKCHSLTRSIKQSPIFESHPCGNHFTMITPKAPTDIVSFKSQWMTSSSGMSMKQKAEETRIG